MHLNSYGWVILIIICIGLLSWVGGEMDYTVNGIDTGGGTLDFITNLAIGEIDGMPLVFTILIDVLPLFVGWIVYRQVRGQD